MKKKRRATATLSGDKLVVALQQALQWHQQGQWAQAEERYQEILRALPQQPDALHYLGLLRHQQNRNGDALPLLEQAARLAPKQATYQFNLAVVAQAMFRWAQAQKHYRRAIELNPGFAMAHNNLGSVLEKLGRLNEANEAFTRALQLDANCAEAINNVGNIQRLQNQFAEAEKSFLRALELNPNDGKAHNNLAMLREQQGRAQEAAELYRQAMALSPAFVGAHSNFLFNLNYRDDVTATQIYEQHLAFARQQYADIGVRQLISHHHERIRIGYVSNDFRRHSVAYFIESLLRHHDRQRFEVYAYYGHGGVDDITRRLQTHCDHWRQIEDMSPAQVAERVINDEIDVLVDLSGQTAGNHLAVFASRAAPLQLTYLGYPNTTGLTQMDYRISDNWADPAPQSDALHSEKLLRLPGGFLAYQAIAERPVSLPPPMLQKGHVTFGSFNNLAKISPACLLLWSRILKALPGSKLLLKSKAFSNPATRQYWLDRLADLGIDGQRLLLRDHVTNTNGHLDIYNEIDIALDTFPYNGTTTTFEALSMGVPVIVMEGDRHAARVGSSIYHSLGLAEFVNEDEESYFNRAMQWACAEGLLCQYRAQLRQRVEEAAEHRARELTQELETELVRILRS